MKDYIIILFFNDINGMTEAIVILCDVTKHDMYIPETITINSETYNVAAIAP